MILTREDVTITWDDNPVFYDEDGELIDSSDLALLTVTYRDSERRLEHAVNISTGKEIEDHGVLRNTLETLAIQNLGYQIEDHRLNEQDSK